MYVIFNKTINWPNLKSKWSNEKYEYKIRTLVFKIWCIFIYFNNLKTEKCTYKLSKKG